MSKASWIARAAVILACAFVHVTAAAAPGEDARDARAREHFKAGVALYDANPPDYAGALSEFEAAMRDKPSWLIEQNIALSLRALRRYPEAFDALQDALARGGAEIRPDARAQMEATAAELAPLIGELHVVLKPEPGARAELVVVVIDGAKKSLDAGEVTLRIGAGEHVVEALSPHFSKKDIVRVAGRERVTLNVIVPAPRGRLHVRAAGADRVFVDEEPLGEGEIETTLSVGRHRLRVDHASGRTTDVGVTIEEGATAELQALDPFQGVDTVTEDPSALHRHEHKWLLEGGAAGIYTNLKFGAPLGEDPSGKNRSLYGAAFLLRASRRVSSHFSLGLTGEIGTTTTGDYTSPLVAGANASSRVDSWAIGGMATFATTGDLAFVCDGSLSFLGQAVTSSLGPGGNDTRSADGIGGAVMLDAGARYSFDRLTLSALGFGALHGAQSVVDAKNENAFQDQPAFRLGVRLLAGVSW